MAAQDSTQIKIAINDFYKWYNSNWEKVNAYKLYKGKHKKDEPPYVIDWKEVDRYIAYLRKNATVLSETFLAAERKRIKEIEKDFIENPDEEMPSGFDYDHFTNSQEEPGYFITELNKKGNKWTINYPSKNKAHLVILYSEGDVFFCSDLTREKRTWKIAGLNCESGSSE